MTLKSDPTFKEKLTCRFKYDMTNFVNFHPTTQKSKNFTLIGNCTSAYVYHQCPKYMKFEVANTEKLSFMTLIQ